MMMMVVVVVVVVVDRVDNQQVDMNFDKDSVDSHQHLKTKRDRSDFTYF